MSAPIQASRREFLVGFAACLALVFAPFERFFEGLRAMCAAVFEASDHEAVGTYTISGKTIDIGTLGDILKTKYSQKSFHDLLYGDAPLLHMVRA